MPAPVAIPDPDRLRCVACGAAGLRPGEVTLDCPACGAAYPLADGIPALVADWPAHERKIAAARQANAAWYEVEQPPEAVSPWRHLIRRYLEARGGDRVGRLLDLGCGDGANLSWLAPFAETLYGSDYNLLRLARAGRRAPKAHLFMADILDYPWADDSFDLIFFNHVIEHIPDDVAALATVHRVLRPGGLLILGTPNEGAWLWQLAYRRAPDIRAGTDHVHFYTARLIGDRMARVGLAVREVKHMGWGPPDWHLDGRIRRYKWVDDAFEIAGRLLMPRQASSLDLIASKS